MRQLEKSKRPATLPWSWSGVEELDFSGGEARFHHLVTLLPKKKSTDAEIVAYLTDLGARFRRWLHQDEFGPTRAQQTASIRALTKSLKVFNRHFIKTSSLVRERLDATLRAGETQSHTVLQALHEAAIDVFHELRSGRGKNADIKHLSDLRNCVETLMGQLELLDTNTETEIFNISLKRKFDLAQVSGPVFSLADTEIWLISFWNVVQDTLTELNKRAGAQERVSLKLLVELLCTLWENETCKPVAAHGQIKDEYTGKPETEAGRFVVAAVEAMLPSSSWFEQRDSFARLVRARTFLPDHQTDRSRQVLGMMRDFVKRRANSKVSAQ